MRKYGAYSLAAAHVVETFEQHQTIVKPGMVAYKEDFCLLLLARLPDSSLLYQIIAVVVMTMPLNLMHATSL